MCPLIAGSQGNHSTSQERVPVTMRRTHRAAFAFVILLVFLLLSFTVTDMPSLDLIWNKDTYYETKFYSPSPSTARRMTEHNREKTLQHYPAGMTRLEDVVDPKHPKKVLIYVLLTASNVETRGKAVIETWMDYANNKHPELGVHVVLAYDGESTEATQRVPMFPVKSTGYGDLYEKVYESFATVWELYGKDYDYFMKADDDLFVHVDRLAAVVGNPALDPNTLQIHGYRDPTGSDMCWGGPGYILSRQALKEIYPHLKRCSDDFGREEDISMAWCFSRYEFNVHNQPWRGCQSVVYNGTWLTLVHIPLDESDHWALWNQPDVEFGIPYTGVNEWKFRNLVTLHPFKSEVHHEPTMQQYYDFYYNAK
ncbi:hypothetical protein BGZ75_009055 [Mortierella antarctica]|nr:hypothetical protein BGZ75_009055 [Mortierella antarctica]